MLKLIISFDGSGNDMQRRYVFIGGVGRSGTSILRELMATNSETIAFPFEYRFLIDPDGLIDFINSYSSWSPYLADRKIKRLERFLTGLGKKQLFPHILGELIRSNDKLKKLITADSYHGWELEEHFPNYLEHVKTLIASLKSFEFSASWAGAESFQYQHQVSYCRPLELDEIYDISSAFCHNLFQGLFEKHQKGFLVEDNTWNLLFINELGRLFQGAKFIHVYRDPRDVVCSYIKQRWMPSDLVQAAMISRDLYAQIKVNVDSKPGDVIEVALEDLVHNSDKVISDISSFVGLDTQPSMLEFPLSASSLGRWRKDLDSGQLKKLEPVLRSTTESLGYEW